jgi:hypothetical protein
MSAPYVSPNGYTDDYGPNVSLILQHAHRVVRAPIPASVRKELSAAVNAGVLGRLKKDGLKPEVFFHPAHRNGALERQKREAEYGGGLVAQVIATPKQVRDGIESPVPAAVADMEEDV